MIAVFLRFSLGLSTTGGHPEGAISSSIYLAIDVPLFNFGSEYLDKKLIAAVSTVGALT